MSSPLELPTLAGVDLEARRMRALPRALLPVVGGRLEVDPEPAALFGTDMLTTELAWGARCLQVACPPALVTFLLSRLDPGLAGAMPEPDLLGLLLEAALLPEIAALEAGSAQSVRCLQLGSDVPATAGRNLPLVFVEGERRWPVLLRGDDAALTELLRRWPVRPLPWAILPIPVRFRLGATRLPLRILRSLGLADVVLLEARPSGAGAIVVGETAVAPAEAEGSSWRLLERPRPPTDTEKDWIMDREDEASTTDEAPGSLDDIPVRLLFDLGQTAMPLGEVRRLGPGTVIETGRATDDFVRISANGRLVGHGRLVDVEGRVGVEIVRLFDHG